MAYTSLHRSLGVQPGRVTAGMLDQAASIGLGEAEDLDWKRDADEVKDNREHAKDFAALANANGGLIITGVAEDGNGGAATVDGIDDARAQALADRFRGIANSMVRPFVPAFNVYTVPLSSVVGRSAVVVQVPRSPEAPHLVPWDKDSWRYPKRVGTDTVWLGESEMETAYRRRFAARQDAEVHLTELAERLDHHLVGAARRVWLVVTAVCSVPALYDTTPAVHTGAIDPVMAEIYHTLPTSGGDSLLRSRLTQLIPRVGLRRVVFSATRPYTGKCDRTYIELHHDASFAGALSVTSPLQHGPTLLPRLDFEQAIRDLVTAAAIHAHRRGGDGMLQLRAATVTEGGELALANRGGQYDRQVDDSLVVCPEPVVTEASLQDLAASPVSRGTAANRLLQDLTHQFAVDDLLNR